MATVDKPVSFIATIDSAKSRHFYETVMSFHCLSDDPFALVFDLGPTTLRIQKVESIPEVNYTVLGWEVASIRNRVNELGEKGVQFEKFEHLPLDESGIWSSPSGALVAWFKDPDGNTLSLTEFPDT